MNKLDITLIFVWGYISIIYLTITILVGMANYLYVLVFLTCAYSKC